MKDVIDVRAREVKEHRSFRRTGGTMLGSQARWRGWDHRAWLKLAVFWLVVLAAAIGLGFATR